MVVPSPILLDVASRHGTPTYAYDLDRLRGQAGALSEHLPPSLEIMYSMKANSSLAIVGVFADLGLGTGVSSAGELVTAEAAGVSPRRILVSGPHKSAELLALLGRFPEAVVSVDSPHEVGLLARERVVNRCVLRLRPDFPSASQVAPGAESRFGIPMQDLRRSRDQINGADLDVVGFHVFAGSQVLDSDALVNQLEAAMDLVRRASDLLGIETRIIVFGGGFGIPYRSSEEPLDVARIGAGLDSLSASVPGARLILELGRYLVGPAGWYLTRVVGYQTQRRRPAVIVDGGTHHLAAHEALGVARAELSPVLLPGVDLPQDASGTVAPTDVLGRLNIPGDVLSSSSLLPPLAPGDVLAFPNVGAYARSASPILFQGAAQPSEVVFTAKRFVVVRPRSTAQDILEGQSRLRIESGRGKLLPRAE